VTASRNRLGWRKRAAAVGTPWGGARAGGARGRRGIQLKRAYDPPGPQDGRRVLADRVWPRGVSRAALRIDQWLRDLGPTPALRTWFGHDPDKWEAFRKRYRVELSAHKAELAALAGQARTGVLTLVYGARDREHNQAVVIREELEQMGAKERES
jgi:uncharacterized protein YeaO (DUF488 family)